MIREDQDFLGWLYVLPVGRRPSPAAQPLSGSRDLRYDSTTIGTGA